VTTVTFNTPLTSISLDPGAGSGVLYEFNADTNPVGMTTNSGDDTLLGESGDDTFVLRRRNWRNQRRPP